MKFSASYGILVGLLMIAQWTVSIVSGSVPELQTAPWAIAFHLVAELSTALILIIGSVSTLKSNALGKQILLVGLGMVIYSEIVSPGYFAEQSQWVLVTMFAVLFLGAVFSVKLLFKQGGQQ